MRNYLGEHQNSHIIGLVQASGSIEFGAKPTGPDVEVANEMIAEGNGQNLVPGRIGPRGGISADTYVDFAKIPDDLWDFFGVKTSNPAITKVQCPLLAWY